MIGKKLKNNRGQEYEVIKATGRTSSRNQKYLIRFISTGYEREVLKVEMDRGKIKDKLSTSVFGVGTLGDVRMVDHKKEYSIWSGMIERCYYKKCSRYPDYGGVGVAVCDRWLTFSNFVEDVKDIEGYDETLFKEGLLELDKDKKQKGVNLKTYSPKTCTFLTSMENNSLKDYGSRKVKFFGKSPDGNVIEICGMKEFAKVNGMLRQGIYNCLNNKSQTCKGWRFSYEPDDLIDR